MSRNLSSLSFRKGLKYNLFDELGKAARQEGAPSAEDLERLADEFLIGKANTYGAATFYDFLKPDNRGKRVYVCNGSACLTAGTQDELKRRLTQHFDDEQIGHMCCLGRCHENRAFQLGETNYSGAAIDRLPEIVAADKEAISAGPARSEDRNDHNADLTNRKVRAMEGASDRYKVACAGTPVLSAGFPGLDEYYSLWNSLLKRDRAELIGEIEASGLRGRGGAGFPMAFKLKACRDAPGDVKFIVCNADEGDPGAYTDRYLLEQRPHAVLFGMMAAGYACGASWGVVYIRGEYPESIRAIQVAVEELYKAGLIGENIDGSGFSFEFKVIAAQGAYICGEETSLLASIEGHRPEVRVRPPYPAQEGLFRKPTVVNNVETLACLHYILSNGGKAYAAIGRGRSTGTKLLSLDGWFKQPGVYEVDMGTPLRKVVDELAGGFRAPVKALHIGGPLGGLVPVSRIDDLSVDFESFAENGFLLGHASVVCLPDDYPLVQYLEHLFEFTSEESCGKCFPCRLGSVRGMEMLQKARHEAYRIDRKLFDDLLETMERGSLCALGGGVPLPVRNALEHFCDELDEYFVN